MGFVDIHNHIMPGVDDGSKDMVMSKQMMSVAYEEGIDTIILTPHYKPGHRHVSVEKIRKCAEEFTSYTQMKGCPIHFYAGNELYYYSEAVERLETGQICSLADSGYLLMEFDPIDSVERIISGVKSIIYAGFIPVIAHIERYQSIVDAPGTVDELIDSGCLVQVNASSITGDFGREARNFTHKLLKEQMVHFVATDAHRAEGRAPYIQRSESVIHRKCGAAYAQQITEDNARRMIAGEDIR